MANETAVKTGEVRFSYVHVFEPQVDDKGKAKYSVSLIIPKTDTVTIKKIEAAIEAAKQQGLAKLGGNLKGVKTPLRDGDEDRPDDEAYAGCMFMSATSARRPGVIDAQLKDLTDDEEFYSGCYGRASVNFYAYNVDKSKGISCGLNNLQKLRDGERLGGVRVSAATDFGGADDMM